MPNESTTISCPQCGSTDVEFENNAILCNACNAKTLLDQSDEQEAITESEVDDDPCIKAEIASSFSKDDFIRKAWITLAREDAPVEVFDGNFSEVTQNDHQVLIDSISVDASYQVSVGYDREEPYIDYETYYEDEPYIAYEEYYDHSIGAKRTRQVTKYKKVQKQRQVTKYKTVTDWSAINGNHHARSIAVVENKPGEVLDTPLFSDSLRGVKDEDIFLLPANEARKIHITKSAKDAATAKHRSSIYSSIVDSLPGDHSRDLDYNITAITDSSATIYKAAEYEASICFNGKIYTKHAFPFGAMKVNGDKIANEISLDAITKKMNKELNARCTERKGAIDKTVWKKTGVLSVISIALLSLSCIASLLIPVTSIIIAALVIALVATIFNKVVEKKTKESVTKDVDYKNKADKEKTQKEISEYSSNYKIKQKERLNEKLKSLGFDPVTADEL